MYYLLDTNVCIKLINNSNQSVTRHLASHEPHEINLSSITVFELYYGAYRSQRKEKNLEILERFVAEFTILDFDHRSAEQAGLIRRQLELNGQPIGVYDVQIAAIALVYNLILVTHNLREFSRVENLVVEDWE